MSNRYRNNSEKFASHMLFEGAAVLLMVGLFSVDSRIQDYLFGREETVASAYSDEENHLQSKENPRDIDSPGLSIDEPGSQGIEDGLKIDRQVSLESSDQPLKLDIVSQNSIEGNRGIQTHLQLREPSQFKRNSTTVDELGELSGPEPGGETIESDSVELQPNLHAESLDNELVGPERLAVDREQIVDSNSETEIAKNEKNRGGKDSVLNLSLEAEVATWWLQEYAQAQMPNRIQLRATLDEVVFVALRNSPQLTIFNMEPAILETLIREEAAAFDWASFAETRWNEIDQPNTDVIRPGQNGRFVQREWTYEAGLRKRLLNGGNIRFGQNYGTLDNNATFLDPPDQGSSRFVIDYTQPLLREAGRSFNTSQILLAHLDFDASASEAIENTQAFIVEVISAYWNLHLARVQLIQNRRSVVRAEELLNQLRGRYGIDVSNDQLLRAEAAAATRRSDVIAAEYNLVNSQDILNNLTMGPEASRLQQIELIPDGLDLPCEFQIDENFLVEVAIQNRPEIRAAFARIKSAAVNQRIQTNLLLPQLDAIVQTSVNGLRGNKDFTGAFVDQFRRGNPSYTVGLTYDLPIGNRAAKARVQRSQLENSLFQSELRQTLGDVMLDVRVAAREVMRLNLETKNNYLALLKAAQELKLIRQRQELGLDDRSGSSYIEDLLASQTRLTVAERRLVDSQRLQAIALVDLKRATGELLQTNSSICPSDIYAVPIQKHQENLPPIVHKIVDSEPDDERDFVPGIKVHFEGTLNDESEVSVRSPLIKKLPNNEFKAKPSIGESGDPNGN